MVLLTALLVACGATATAVPQDQPEPTIARPVPLEIKPTSAPPPTMVVSTRDTLRFLTSEEPTTIGAASPNCGGNLQNTICDDMASDPLTWIDTASFQVVPMTGIESWEQRDPRRWRFKLRDGVKFHNGAPWNAEQAKFWIDFFGDEQTSGHNNSNDFSFHGVMGGEVVDPLTLDVVCKNACPILPRTTIFTKFQDVGWFKTATPADIERNTVGLGPYKIVEWRAGVQVELEAFKDYKPNKAYDSQAPSIKRVIQMWRNEPLVRASMMATGEADWAEISFEDRNRVAKWKSGTNNEVSLYAIDTVHHPELRKKEVREALNLAIDCKTLMAKLYDNLMECYGNTAQTGTVGITPQNSAPYGYNPARARLLLKQAGYNPANKITLSIRSQRVPKDVEYAEAAVTYWREVGINADLAVLEASQWNTVSRSNCGHMRTRAELQNAPGADLHEKCRSLGAGPPRFSSMNLSGTATSTESLDWSRHAVQRNSCYSRTSGVCFGDLEKLIEEASATDTGPLRAQRLQAVADRAHNEFYFVPVTQVVSMYALAKNLEWQPNYAPRLRANTMKFTK
jgi:ABC-type transport system substrate-binding protein